MSWVKKCHKHPNNDVKSETWGITQRYGQVNKFGDTIPQLKKNCRSLEEHKIFNLSLAAFKHARTFFFLIKHGIS